MKKILFYFLCFLIITPNVYAHPPSKINVTYNKADSSLSITINHRISRSGGKSKKRKHFIKEVSLYLNGETSESKTFNKQRNDSIVRTKLSLPQYENNDIFLIKATCSKGDELTKSIPASSLTKYQKAKESSSY